MLESLYLTSKCVRVILSFIVLSITVNISIRGPFFDKCCIFPLIPWSSFSRTSSCLTITISLDRPSLVELRMVISLAIVLLAILSNIFTENKNNRHQITKNIQNFIRSLRTSCSIMSDGMRFNSDSRITAPESKPYGYDENREVVLHHALQ